MIQNVENKKIKDLKQLLKFDYLDEKNSFIALTKYNVELIEFIIQNDSRYRSDADTNNSNSTKSLVRKYKECTDNSEKQYILKKILISIDKQNSTHLSVSGTKKSEKQKNNKGIDKILDYLCNTITLSSLDERIKNGDTSLVDNIAINGVEGRYNISFASKFCTYMSRYMYDNDNNFSIYDNILRQILPYYYYQYVNKDTILTINNKYMLKNGYENYNNKIAEILSNYKVKNEKISRKDFDHLLWYYYKGDKDIKVDNIIVYESRITKAIKSII